jgi:acyl phosphate:glycerol-3-phosphate acyltransferase
VNRVFSFNEYLFLCLVYLIGSVPFGIIVAKMGGIGDITKLGSGNMGATNITRIGGRKLGAITFGLDFLKGLIPLTIYIYQFGVTKIAFIGAVICVIGHIFPIFNRFKGGKGVATSLGVIMALNPELCLIMLAIWVIFFLLTKISSASALFSFALMPFIIFALKSDNDLMIFGITLSIIIYISHLENIKRLLNGSEKSFK